MAEFFQTQMGRKFFEADVPRALKAIERIADKLEQKDSAAAYKKALQYIADNDPTWRLYINDALKSEG